MAASTLFATTASTETHICIYIYIYIHMQIHVYVSLSIYIYIYIERERYYMFSSSYVFDVFARVVIDIMLNGTMSGATCFCPIMAQTYYGKP